MEIFVIVNLVGLIICFFVARDMVKNRKGLAKGLAIGKDDEEVIKKKKKIATDIISTGKFVIIDEENPDDNTLEGYDVKICTKSGVVSKVEVKTSKTRLIFNLEDYKPLIHNTAFSERGAIAYTTFGLWCIIFTISFMVLLFSIAMRWVQLV